MKLHGMAGIDVEEVQRALKLFFDPAMGHEITTLPNRDRDAKAFRQSDSEAALQHIEAIHARAPKGVYWVINPMTPARWAENQTECLRPSTKDIHVACRRWLFLDFDPKREPDTNATEEEHQRAKAVAISCRDYLTEIGWPLPVEMDSGNGYALFYRIQLENDDAAKKLIKAVLESLNQRFSGQVEIDKAVYNAARLARLPGTINRKGPHSADRPCRRCRLISVPELKVVHADQLAALAAAPSLVLSSKDNAYAEAALRAELMAVRHAPEGNRNNTFNRAAFNLYRLVAGGALDASIVEAELVEAAMACGLSASEVRATLASAREAGMRQPRIPQKMQTVPHVPQELSRWELRDDNGLLIAEGDELEWPEYAQAQNQKTYQVLKSATIMNANYPPPKWVAEGLLTEGLSILAGGPKLGKSILALNLALTVAGGGTALGSRAVQGGQVLYLALEDVYRRIKKRQEKMLVDLPTEVAQKANERLEIATRWRRQDKGGLAMIDKWVQARSAPVLVIIDVWNRYQPSESSRSLYRNDADSMAALKALADYHQISVLVIHHTRKSSALTGGEEDFIEEVSGTLGLAGTADTIIGLLRTRGENGAILKYTGRDVDTNEISVDFDVSTLTWREVGKSQTVEQRILDHLQICGNDGATVAEVAAAIRHNPASVRVMLNRMRANQLVGKRGNNWMISTGIDDAVVL